MKPRYHATRKQRRRARRDLNRFFKRIGQGKRVAQFPKSMRKVFG